MKTHARATATSALVLVAVFVAGALVGRALEPAQEPADPSVQGTATDAPAEAAPRRTPMYERVGLDDAQRVIIDSIVVHYRSGVRELQRQSREAYEQEYMMRVDAVRQAIKGVMTLEQRVMYDSLTMESDRRRQERREERGSEGTASGGEG